MSERIGVSVPRIEGVTKTAGEGVFVDDVYLPGMLFGALRLSPHAHAQIGKIDPSAALALAGVHAVVTGEDFPGNLGVYTGDKPPWPGIGCVTGANRWRRWWRKLWIWPVGRRH